MSLRREWITRPVAELSSLQADGWTFVHNTRVFNQRFPQKLIEVVVLWRAVDWSASEGEVAA